MKRHYYPETDSLYIELGAGESAETRAISDDVNIDFAADGAVVGIDIDHASTKSDLTTLDATTLPLADRRAA